jgi:hypothetical protein
MRLKINVNNKLKTFESMKKNFMYAFLSAIALSGAVSFSACSSSDELENVNPTYDGTSVRTDFAFNIAKGTTGTTTRMISNNTQESGNFRGLTNMILMPFSATPNDNVETNSTVFTLGSLTSSDIYTESDPTLSSRVYSLQLPIGTDNFLFYGLADRNSLTNNQIGKVTTGVWNITSADKVNTTVANVSSGIKTISFGLTPIQSTLAGDASNILGYLNAISDATTGTVLWSSSVTTATTDGAYSSLADLYTKFTTVKAGEARSGSGESVVRMVLDLYKSARAINGQSSVQGVKDIAAAICTAITTGYTSGSTTVKVKILESDAANASEVSSTTDINTADNWVGEADGFDVNFPHNEANNYLPMGAAQLTCTSGDFAYNDATTWGATGTTTLATTNLSKINYPAELIYYDNSPILVTDTYKKATDYPTTVGSWDADASWSTDWSKGAVASSTRAVAMKNNVNYGVALFQTNVALNGTTDNKNLFTDNRNSIIHEANQADIDGTKFTVTGILIGGQPSTVGWNMVNGTSFDNMIYDSDVATTLGSGNLSKTATANNYTIVFDNWFNGEQKDVYFALELVNGDKDFYGAHNLIPKGSTFYLVGKMGIDGKTLTAAHQAKDTDYRITNETTPRVFVQDYKTVANITISTNALQKAYSTIPDLVSTQTVFGLSVDLSWETGISFDVEINGN